MAAEFLESVGIHDMRIDLGSVAYMDALFEELRLSKEELSQVREFLEKRNLVSLRSWLTGCRSRRSSGMCSWSCRGSLAAMKRR